MWLYFSQLQMAALSTGGHVATMSSLAQLQVQDTKKQRQCRCESTRMTESKNGKGKQLLMMSTESLTDWEWLPGELFSGLECTKAQLGVKYQTCFKNAMGNTYWCTPTSMYKPRPWWPRSGLTKEPGTYPTSELGVGVAAKLWQLHLQIYNLHTLSYYAKQEWPVP